MKDQNDGPLSEEYYGRKCLLEEDEEPGKSIGTEFDLNDGKITVVPQVPKDAMASAKSFTVVQKGIVNGEIECLVASTNDIVRTSEKFRERCHQYGERLIRHGCSSIMI